jgi:hypothetical protein
MNFENRPTHSLRPYAGNARTHSPKQIKQIARSIERFGFNNPVLVDDDVLAAINARRKTSGLHSSDIDMIWLLALPIICLAAAVFMWRFERYLEQLSGPWISD